MVIHSTHGLLSNLFSTPEMDQVFSDAEQVRRMLRFEWALSAALEDCALAPPRSSEPLAALLAAPFLTPDRANQLRVAAGGAGNIAIPFVKLLTAVVAEQSPHAASFIHTGATSQDVLDTALVLQIRDATTLLQADLQKTLARCVQLAREHAGTILPGRTWLQQGPPVTLGLKFAGYAAALSRHEQRLRDASARAVVLQFGGAVGTLASLREHGLRVSSALASRLDLPESPLPWHAQRDNLGEVAAVLGLLTGTLGKMARDISLAMQTEVGELFEPAGEGRGGSSTMPHKRNPVGCAVVLAAAHRVPPLVATMLAAMPQEHERGLGGWHAEWETLPEIFRRTAGALSQIRQIVDGLEIDAARMTANVQMTHGLVLAESVGAALAEFMGRLAAHRIVEQASRKAVAEQRPLESILAEMPAVTENLSAERLHQLLDSADYLGSAQQMIDRTLQSLEQKGD
jgi:3-carboxy-cis,cis-muconate cycloisomerase